MKYTAGKNGFQVLNGPNGSPAPAAAPAPQYSAPTAAATIQGVPQWAQQGVNYAVPQAPQPAAAPTQANFNHFG